VGLVGQVGEVSVGQILIIIGLVIAAIGVLIWLGVPIGRLPGDIMIRRGNFTFYLPVTTSILASVVLTLIAMWLRR
jgi:Protein of unknown function (DUF2905)